MRSKVYVAGRGEETVQETASGDNTREDDEAETEEGGEAWEAEEDGLMDNRLADGDSGSAVLASVGASRSRLGRTRMITRTLSLIGTSNTGGNSITKHSSQEREEEKYSSNTVNSNYEY